MNQVGKTEDGRIVVNGIGKMYFETGLPLSVAFDGLKKCNLVPSIPHLIQELKDNGMKEERITHLLNEHLFESYGKEHRDLVISRLAKV